MESESINDYDKQKKEHRNLMSDDSDIPEPISLRCDICMGNEGYRGLLDYNVYLLCVGAAILLCSLLFA